MADHGELDAFLARYREQAARPAQIRETLERILKPLDPADPHSGGATAAQRAFILDPHRRLALIAPRRVGKTSGFLRRFARGGLTGRNRSYRYLALSRPHAEELLWTPLKEFADENKIRGRFMESDLTFQFADTGSRLQLLGADDRKEVDKNRGAKHHGIGVDEAGHFPRKLLSYAIDDVLLWTLADYRGWLALGGTPGQVLAGMFFDATRVGALRSRPYRDPGPEWASIQCSCPDKCAEFEWSLHRWSIDDAALPHIKAEALAAKAAKGWTDDNPKWRREGRGEWAADDTGMVYRYQAHRTIDDEEGERTVRWNSWAPPAEDDRKTRTPTNPFGLPGAHRWRYVLGIDLGNKKVQAEERARNPDKLTPNRLALVVLAYSDTCRDLYQAWERALMPTGKGSVTELAGVIHWLKKKIGGEFDGVFVDLAGAGGMILDELAAVHGIAAEAAEKKNKPDAIELTNSDLVDGHLKVIEGSQLEAEMLSLQWDEIDPTRENKSQANDFCDACIYARRGALHHFAQEPARRLSPQEKREEDVRSPLRAETRRAIKRRERELEAAEFDTFAESEWDTGFMEP